MFIWYVCTAYVAIYYWLYIKTKIINDKFDLFNGNSYTICSIGITFFK